MHTQNGVDNHQKHCCWLWLRQRFNKKSTYQQLLPLCQRTILCASLPVSLIYR